MINYSTERERGVWIWYRPDVSATMAAEMLNNENDKAKLASELVSTGLERFLEVAMATVTTAMLTTTVMAGQPW